jgi:acetyl-CoA synthetase
MKSMDEYKKVYNMSINDPEKFIKEQAIELLHWDKLFTKVYDKETDSYFKDGMLNACYNVLDRHYKNNPDKTAFICVSNDDEHTFVTYKELMDLVLQKAYFFRSIGLKKGDVVTFYGNNSLDFYSCVLACGRLGLVCHFVFGGYSSHMVGERLIDTNTKLVITLDHSERGEKSTFYFNIVNEAIRNINYENHVLVFNKENILTDNGNIHLWSEVSKLPYDFVPCTSVNANDDFFVIFTSGSSGKSKGIVHSTAGFLFGIKMTIKLNFDYCGQDDQIFFSTADIGWLACFSHSIYGPLLWGGTSVVFVGIPFYPSYMRVFDIISRNKITHFYTAPTVIRMLQKYMQENDLSVEDIKKKYDLSSLRILGSVGELLNEGSLRFLESLTDNGIPIINTYWQTETGTIMISPLPLKDSNIKGVGVPTYLMKPRIAKIDPVTQEVVDCEINEKGILLFSYKWPSLAKTLLNDHQRYKETYLKMFPGYYYTGDEAVCDKDGNYSVLGRVDDVINVCGHRISTLEIENNLSSCKGISELAVVGLFDEITGQKVCLNVVLINGYDVKKVAEDIRKCLTRNFGKILRNYEVKFFDELPKTRTGKFMRRVLRESGCKSSSISFPLIESRNESFN